MSLKLLQPEAASNISIKCTLRIVYRWLHIKVVFVHIYLCTCICKCMYVHMHVSACVCVTRFYILMRKMIGSSLKSNVIDAPVWT